MDKNTNSKNKSNEGHTDVSEISMRICYMPMREGYCGIVGKYGIPRIRLLMVLLFRRNTMNFSRRPSTMQCSKKRPHVVVVPFSADQSVFCDLQEFFR